MIGFTEALSSILDANPGLRAIVIRPLPRRDLDHPVFGAGMAILQVRSVFSLFLYQCCDFTCFSAVHQLA